MALSERIFTIATKLMYPAVLYLHFNKPLEMVNTQRALYSLTPIVLILGAIVFALEFVEIMKVKLCK